MNFIKTLKERGVNMSRTRVLLHGMADWFSKLRITDELRALKTPEDLRGKTGPVHLKLTNFKLMSHSHLFVYNTRFKTQEKWIAKHSISTMNIFFLFFF